MYCTLLDVIHTLIKCHNIHRPFVSRLDPVPQTLQSATQTQPRLRSHEPLFPASPFVVTIFILLRSNLSGTWSVTWTRLKSPSLSDKSERITPTLCEKAPSPNRVYLWQNPSYHHRVCHLKVSGTLQRRDYSGGIGSFWPRKDKYETSGLCWLYFTRNYIKKEIPDSGGNWQLRYSFCNRQVK